MKKEKLQEKLSAILVVLNPIRIYKSLKTALSFKLAVSLQKITNSISFKIRTSYIYYYYICLKDFIIKLLNPKKMMIVKWREATSTDYLYYSEIPLDMIYKCSENLLQSPYNGNGHTYKFRIKNNNSSLDRIDNYIFKPNESFRLIGGGEVDYILTKDDRLFKIIVDCKILATIINDGIEKDFNIDDIHRRNRFAIVSHKDNSVAWFDNVDQDLILECDPSTDLGRLRKRELSDFINNFKLRN